jgi:hypothetical protein
MAGSMLVAITLRAIWKDRRMSVIQISRMHSSEQTEESHDSSHTNHRASY